MKLFDASCQTCRMIRRLLMALGFGWVLVWQLADADSAYPGNALLMDGVLVIAVIFAFLSIFLRLREIRTQLRKRR
jgi:hypothetical protein